MPSMMGALVLYLLASELCVFSIRIAAYALMFSRLASEVFLFLIGFCTVLMAYATAAAALKIEVHAWDSVWICALTLTDIFMGTAHEEDRRVVEEEELPALRMLVMSFYSPPSYTC
mmetsp:Transcript_70238/g.203669  ORF Transcript_70238/g.203669 Transcript_70238/m.203669 type:complete len:116 (+) Transcript_70238:2-349(+)